MGRKEQNNREKNRKEQKRTERQRGRIAVTYTHLCYEHHSAVQIKNIHYKFESATAFNVLTEDLGRSG